MKHMKSLTLILSASALSAFAATHDVANLADYTNIRNPLKVKTGDTITLPEGDYCALNTRILKVEGTTVTVIAPGIVGLQKLNGEGGVETTGAILSVPDPIGDGSVFLWNPNHWSSSDWCSGERDTWDVLEGPAGEKDYPSKPNDIAILARYNDWAFEISVKQDISLGGLMIGAYAIDKEMSPYRYTVRGDGTQPAPTLSFARTDGGTPWILVCPAGNEHRSNWPIAVAFGDGNENMPLNVYCAHDVICDLGWDGVSDDGCFAYFQFRKGATLTIPEGKSFTFVNGSQKAGGGLFNVVECLGKLAGAGDFVNLARTSIKADFDATDFTGRLVESSAARSGYDRSANTWFQNATTFGKATLEINGFVTRTDYKSYPENKGAGFVRIGQHHNWPGQPEIGNRLPGTVVLNGGFLELYDEQTQWSEGAVNEYVAKTMMVNNGATLLYAIGTSNESLPQTLVKANELEHPGKGALIVRSNRLWTNNGEYCERIETCFPDGRKHMIGGIIPWLVAWSDQPDYGNYGGWESLRFPTLDADGNLRNLDLENTRVNDAAENANVYSSGQDITLSADKTINSLAFSNQYSGSNKIGEGRTLTIASGGLIMNAKTRIGANEAWGDPNPAVRNGTLAFGDTAYIFSNTPNNGRDGNRSWIMSKMIAPKGLVMAHPGFLTICADQRGIDDELVVATGELTLGLEGDIEGVPDMAIPCQIDVPVRLVGGGSRLILAAGTKLDREQNLLFDDVGGHAGKVEIPAGNDQECLKCYVAGVSLARGTWGATGSGADHIDDAHFAGTGILTVRKDDNRRGTVIFVR